MRVLLFCLFFLTACAFGQDTMIADKTLEGTYKKSMCTVDTLISLHLDKKIVIVDSTNLEYEFKSGKRSYVEIRLRSTICSCKDCSFADHLSIDVTGLKPGDKVSISPENTTWIHWNSMMMVNLEQNFAGTLTYNGENDFVLEVYKFIPAQPQVRYDGVRVVKS
jgi:hypothetical protein